MNEKIYINKNFTQCNPGNNSIVVDSDFEPLRIRPKDGFKWEWVNFKSGTYKQVKIIIPEPEKTPEGEQAWVRSEFDDFVDPIANMFWSGDTRSKGYVEQEIKDYSNKLRDYVTEHNGELQINGSRPPRPEKHIRTKSKK